MLLTHTIPLTHIRHLFSAWVVIGAFTFVWGLVGTFLSVQQFKGRKGSYTGKGTSLWATSGIIYLVMTALWLGVTAAYTYYAVNQSYTLQGEADLQEPLSEPLRFLTYQIAQSFWTGYADALFVPTSLSQLGISTVTLGPWGTATSLSQVNDLAGKYKSIHFYRAELICCWFGLATVFTAFAVHVLMPITLRTLGWTRSEKKLREEAPLVPFEDKDYYPYPYHY